MFDISNKFLIFVRNIKHYETGKICFIASSCENFGRNGREHQVGAAPAETERRTGF
jgi:hypothetical protein